MQLNEVKKMVGSTNFLQNEEKFRTIMIDPVGEDLLHRFFTQIFSSFSVTEVRKNWWGGYRLFVEIGWKKMRGLPSDFVVEVCFGQQLVMACILGYEPIDEMLWYLGLRFPDKTDAVTEYSRMRKTVFESDMVVGVYKNQPQVVKDIAKEIIRLNQMGNPSLEVAEFKARLETVFFSEIPDVRYIERLGIDKRESVATFFSFIHFLIGVEPERVYGLIDLNLRADDAVREEMQEKESGKIRNLESKKENEISKNYFVEIKDGIQRDLASGVLEDQFEIFGVLEKYAEQYSDSRILDLCYYDEQQEKFVWNEELLTSS